MRRKPQNPHSGNSGVARGSISCSGPNVRKEGRTLPLDFGPANGRFRRNLVVAASSGQGPLTIRFADLRHRAFANGGLLSYGLCPGKPPEGKLDRGEGHEGGQGYGKVLEVLGDQRAGR